MLDFDFLSKRKEPSVAAIHFPFAGNHYQKFYMGNTEVLIPVYVACRPPPHWHIVPRPVCLACRGLCALRVPWTGSCGDNRDVAGTRRWLWL